MESNQCFIAKAIIIGGPLAPDLRGVVIVREAFKGSEVYTHVVGLPPFQPADNGNPIGPHGFHIHDEGDCTIGDPEDPFQDAGSHWAPYNEPHGNHAGDFPVLFSNDGRAIMSFYTDKFIPQDVIGKSIIIHQNPDDYRSQPTGDAGKRLGCGVFECILQ
ncbi:Cu-Zn family superoxide dismutase [Natranaerovirga hydrolytica]|uniref:Cu-Zn family superoxide dismutase n=1 Tax=Natranaerovirga hydrolytica TaxID=680378 RepID=A0A4R1MLE9_9FIRM|nr:superoxide dismutase family protein [Natranaerovirga hydrolytica]TCK92910.1 Cu-Zn family superoxide dismutase [Natranaerovirga hydrolytica]